MIIIFNYNPQLPVSHWPCGRGASWVQDVHLHPRQVRDGATCPRRSARNPGTLAQPRRNGEGAEWPFPWVHEWWVMAGRCHYRWTLFVIINQHYSWQRQLSLLWSDPGWKSGIDVCKLHLIISSYLSLPRKGHWSTTDDFATSFPHSFVLSTALFLSSHLFLCLPCLLPPFTVPCKMVLARPNERKIWPYHCSLHLFTMVSGSSCGLIACLSPTGMPTLNHPLQIFLERIMTDTLEDH